MKCNSYNSILIQTSFLMIRIEEERSDEVFFSFDATVQDHIFLVVGVFFQSGNKIIYIISKKCSLFVWITPKE
jgi:hypothetical protein